MNKIYDLVKQLKNEPLFYLFVSSKELFHSNFWYWMGKKTDFGSDLTPQLFSSKILVNPNFKREVRKSKKSEKGEKASKGLIVDLVIYENDKPKIIIENKVKDFPTVEQLERIREAFSFDEGIDFVLTSLYPVRNNIYPKWNILSYKDIAKSINPEKFSNNEFHVSLIREYQKFISLLSDLAHELPCNSNYDFAISFSKDLFNTLNEIKLWEGYQKMRASDLLQKFKDKYADIETYYSINHQKATIGFTYNIKNYNLGIQIENDQFRKFISGKNAKKIACHMMSSNIFFDEILNQERKSKDFLKYNDDWTYQYTKLKKPLPFDELFEMINFEMGYLKSNHKKIETFI